MLKVFVKIPVFLIEEMEKNKKDMESLIQIPIYIPIPEYPIDAIREEEEEIPKSRIIIIDM